MLIRFRTASKIALYMPFDPRHRAAGVQISLVMVYRSSASGPAGIQSQILKQMKTVIKIILFVPEIEMLMRMISPSTMLKVKKIVGTQDGTR